MSQVKTAPEVMGEAANLKQIYHYFKTFDNLENQQVRDILMGLWQKGAISFPVTDSRHYWMQYRDEAAQTIAKLSEVNRKWLERAKTVNADYVSSVWTNANNTSQDCEAIRPLPTFNWTEMSAIEKSVFGYIGDLYIQSFDPNRSYSQGSAPTRRRFLLKRHVKQASLSDTVVDIVGPAFKVMDAWDVRFYVPIDDGVSGDAWAAIPVSVIRPYMFDGINYDDAAIGDFLTTNSALCRELVGSLNGFILPDSHVAYTLAEDTFETFYGVRYYKWPKGLRGFVSGDHSFEQLGKTART